MPPTVIDAVSNSRVDPPIDPPADAARSSLSVIRRDAAPPKASPPRRRLRAVWIAVIVAVAAALAVVGYMFNPFVTAPLAVTVETVVAGPLTRILAVNGKTAAVVTVKVRSAVSGTVVSLEVAEGDAVKSGVVLARINADTQTAVVRQTEAALQAGVIAKAQADAAFLRAEALTRSLSRSAIDTAESAANAAAQDVARLTALLDQARLQLDRFAVTAPIDGTILSIDTEPGQLVDPTAAFMTLADLGSLVVETDIDETYATRIAKGMPVLIQLAGAAQTRPGSVAAVSSQVDATTGGLSIKVAFDDPVVAPVGLTATMNIIVETLDAAISVPRAALVATSEGRGVFVVEAGLARKTAVTVTEWPAERLVVTAGLKVGDVIITEAAGLTDGAAVKVTPEPKGP